MTIKRVTDDTIRVQLEHDIDALNELYAALLTPRKTEPQRALLKQLALDLKAAVPELTDPKPPPAPPAAAGEKDTTAKKTGDKDKP